MRIITNHIVEGDAPDNQVIVTVLDEPGAGGANHEYLIATPGDPQGLETGCSIHFQNGPIKEVGVNGITHESMLAVLIDRLTSFQAGPFPSPFNAEALHHGRLMLRALQLRTRERIARGVEGKNIK